MALMSRCSARAERRELRPVVANHVVAVRLALGDVVVVRVQQRHGATDRLEPAVVRREEPPLLLDLYQDLPARIAGREGSLGWRLLRHR